MSRRYQRAVLAIKAVPAPLVQAKATCPTCGRLNPSVLRRVGSRLVFPCSDCHIEFFRHSGQTSTVRATDQLARDLESYRRLPSHVAPRVLFGTPGTLQEARPRAMAGIMHTVRRAVPRRSDRLRPANAYRCRRDSNGIHHARASRHSNQFATKPLFLNSISWSSISAGLGDQGSQVRVLSPRLAEGLSRFVSRREAVSELAFSGAVPRGRV
jgi:hypothetical protein